MKTVFVSILLVLHLTQCNSVKKMMYTDDEFIEEITLDASDDVNGNTPVTIDLVISKHPGITQRLAKLNSVQFDIDKKQIKRDFPQEIKIITFEIIPGQSMKMPLSYTKSEVDSVFLYVDFHNKATNRWRIFAADFVNIQMKGFDVLITSQNEEDANEKNRKILGLF